MANHAALKRPHCCVRAITPLAYCAGRAKRMSDRPLGRSGCEFMLERQCLPNEQGFQSLKLPFPACTKIGRPPSIPLNPERAITGHRCCCSCLLASTMSVYNGVLYSADPPDGIERNPNQTPDATILTVVTGITFALSTISMATRLYGRIVLIKQFSFDDCKFTNTWNNRLC